MASLGGTKTVPGVDGRSSEGIGKKGAPPRLHPFFIFNARPLKLVLLRSRRSQMKIVMEL